MVPLMNKSFLSEGVVFLAEIKRISSSRYTYTTRIIRPIESDPTVTNPIHSKRMSEGTCSSPHGRRLPMLLTLRTKMQQQFLGWTDKKIVIGVINKIGWFEYVLASSPVVVSYDSLYSMPGVLLAGID